MCKHILKLVRTKELDGLLRFDVYSRPYVSAQLRAYIKKGVGGLDGTLGPIVSSESGAIDAGLVKEAGHLDRLEQIGGTAEAGSP